MTPSTPTFKIAWAAHWGPVEQAVVCCGTSPCLVPCGVVGSNRMHAAYWILTTREIKEAKELLDAGLLTQQEFDQKKAEIIASV